MTLLDDIIYGATDEGSRCATHNRMADYAVLQLERNRDYIVSEIDAYIDSTYTTTVTNATAATDVFTCADTSWMQRNAPIRFTGTVFGGVSTGTTYYIQVDPYNSQNQNGTRMFFDATTTTPPGIPTNLTRSTGNAGSKTFSWSAPTTGGSVTSYEYQLNSTGWISNGSSTSVALTGLSGTNTFQVRAIGPGGTGTSASTGSFVIPTINSGPTAGSITSSGATISWTSTNQSSYSLSVPGATGTPFTGTTATSRSLSLSSISHYLAHLLGDIGCFHESLADERGVDAKRLKEHHVLI
jgi:hypothetical protein